MAHFTDEQFESFRNAYVRTMLWSSTDERPDHEGESLDDNFSEDDLSDEACDQIDAECKAFLYRAACFIPIDPEAKCGPDFDVWGHAGHDFWLTRCRHGAGFWDGDWPTYGDMFDKMAKTFPELDCYVGDDGLIYIA